MNLDISILLGLLGGLALFLYGMQMMSAGLEAAAGNRMKGILERLTSNRFLGILVGAGITAVIQSSSATTVMVVGFVNSGMMTLKQAVWIIMGQYRHHHHRPAHRPGRGPWLPCSPLWAWPWWSFEEAPDSPLRKYSGPAWACSLSVWR